MSVPTYDDLEPFAQAILDRLYAARDPRESDGSKRQSREDFRAGCIAAAMHFRVRSWFRPGVEDDPEVAG